MNNTFPFPHTAKDPNAYCHYHFSSPSPTSHTKPTKRRKIYQSYSWSTDIAFFLLFANCCFRVKLVNFIFHFLHCIFTFFLQLLMLSPLKLSRLLFTIKHHFQNPFISPSKYYSRLCLNLQGWSVFWGEMAASGLCFWPIWFSFWNVDFWHMQCWTRSISWHCRIFVKAWKTCRGRIILVPGISLRTRVVSQVCIATEIRWLHSISATQERDLPVWRVDLTRRWGNFHQLRN